MGITRRDFLRDLTIASGVAAAGNWLSSDAVAQSTSALPHPTASGIEHIVVVTMENRSFDHVLGWLPNAEGRQAGLYYRDAHGKLHPTFPLAPDDTGCAFADPDHSYAGARIQYNDGAIDGFVRQSPDLYPIGYYTEADRPFANALARQFTALDHSFCSILGPTFPNRMFMHAAQTDRLTNSFDLSSLPTIWDSLARAGVSHAYYFSNLPFLGLWGPKYIPISRPYQQFLQDAQAGTLPAVSFVDPRYTLIDDGTGNDDHPHADIRRGDAFLAQTFHAVATGGGWPKTVFVVTCDEWGGFFDHVRPPRAAAPNGVDSDLVSGRALLGFRVPTIIASPWSRNTRALPWVSHHVCDHTSILKMIEWRWQLPALTARDASNDIHNLATVLRFDRAPVFDVPALPQPAAPLPHPCPSVSGPLEGLPGASSDDAEWMGLLRSGLLKGWSLGD
jgi:phospholipase C